MAIDCVREQLSMEGRAPASPRARRGVAGAPPSICRTRLMAKLLLPRERRSPDRRIIDRRLINPKIAAVLASVNARAEKISFPKIFSNFAAPFSEKEVTANQPVLQIHENVPSLVILPLRLCFLRRHGARLIKARTRLPRWTHFEIAPISSNCYPGKS